MSHEQAKKSGPETGRDKLNRIGGIIFGAMAVISVGLWGYSKLTGAGDTEAYVECSSDGEQLLCTVEHKKGNSRTKVCWDFVTACANGGEMVGNACAAVEPGEKVSRVLTDDDFTGVDSCDSAASSKVANVKLTTDFKGSVPVAAAKPTAEPAAQGNPAGSGKSAGGIAEAAKTLGAPEKIVKFAEQCEAGAEAGPCVEAAKWSSMLMVAIADEEETPQLVEKAMRVLSLGASAYQKACDRGDAAACALAEKGREVLAVVAAADSEAIDLEKAAKASGAPRPIIKLASECAAGAGEDIRAASSCSGLSQWFTVKADRLHGEGDKDAAQPLYNAAYAAMNSSCELGMALACNMLEMM